MEVHKNKIVQELQAFYGEILYPESEITIMEYLSQQAVRLWSGIQERNPVVFTEITNYDSQYTGKNKNEIPLEVLTEEVAFRTIACEYGYRDWEDVEVKGQGVLDLRFENAVNLILAGRLNDLKRTIEKRQSLVFQRSQFGHRATLLLYTGTNGVEAWRQVVPMNLPEIVAFLLENGAEKEAKMNVYGGQFDTLALASTSGHPFEAGIGEDLLAALK